VGIVMPMAAPDRSYLICSTPRTGSSLLCDALTDTGVAGRPEEYFQFRARTGFPRRPREYFEGAEDTEIFDILGPRTWVEQDESRYDPSRFERYEDYLAWALEAGTTPNGVFGAKVMWGYFNGFVTGLRWAVPGRQRLAVSELAPSVFPSLRYLWVTRRDKVRQAVSLWRALQTWSWSSDQNPAGARGHLAYSHAAIAHLIGDIEAHEREWRAYFRECAVEPLTIVYEEFAVRYEDTVREILRYLDVSEADAAPIVAPTRGRQSDDLSREWADRYLSETGRLTPA
jgi:trehalose 2-sulfotransferase